MPAGSKGKFQSFKRFGSRPANLGYFSGRPRLFCRAGAAQGPGFTAETTGIFKGKERKAKEAEIEAAEKRASDLKDKISRMVQEQGYPDGQAFMAAYNKAESIVKRYEWELAEWKQQVEGKPADEKKPPERKSVLAQLHRIRDEAQRPPKRSYRDRDER